MFVVGCKIETNQTLKYSPEENNRKKGRKVNLFI